MTLFLRFALTFVLANTGLLLDTISPWKSSGLKSLFDTSMADCEILYSFMVVRRWDESHSNSRHDRLHTATLRGASALEMRGKM